MSLPKGVHTFGHAHSSDKGSKHPSDIGPGLETTESEGGKDASLPSYTKGSASFRKGVVRGDGTERRRGTKVVKKSNSPKQPKAPIDDSFLPVGAGLHKNTGTSVPKRVK